MMSSNLRVLIPAGAFLKDRIDLVARIFSLKHKVYKGITRNKVLDSWNEQPFYELFLENEGQLHHITDRLTDHPKLVATEFDDIPTYVVEDNTEEWEKLSKSLQENPARFYTCSEDFM